MATLKDLISLLNKGFFASNLHELLNTSEELLNTGEHKLVYFTLKGLFYDLSIFYDSTPVKAEKEQILTAGIKEKIIELLNNIANADRPSLEHLISLYQSNKKKLINKNLQTEVSGLSD